METRPPGSVGQAERAWRRAGPGARARGCPPGAAGCGRRSRRPARDVRVRGPDGRQQHALGAGHRDVVVARSKPKLPARPQQPESSTSASIPSAARRPGRPRSRARRAGGSAPARARAARRDDGGAQGVGVLGEHLGQRADARARRGGERLVGQQLGPVGAQHRGARRLQPDDRDAGGEPRLERPQAAAAGPGGRRRAGRWRSRSARSTRCAAAARRRSRGPRAPRRRRRDLGVEVVGERVRPQQQARAGGPADGA